MRIKLGKSYLLMTIASLVVLALAGALLLFSSRPEKASAHLNGFSAGNIISDFVMSNKSSMTEAAIQTFLKSKANCNDRNLSKVSNPSTDVAMPSVEAWHVKDGHFVCLADEFEWFGGETAAHIISQAAMDYSINPQVLIVLLQKEQGLITDSFPRSGQYRIATGYGCPDTAACDNKYYGFKNQIRWAASLFRTVLDGGWSNYPVGNRYVQYNPNASCGGSIINIENRATSALYRYTPYQPNAAALAAGTGTAPCGAYGNRNFYHYFTEWFGDTRIVFSNTSWLISGAIYEIKSGLSSNKNLMIADEQATGTAKAQIWDNTSSDDQRFKLVKNSDNTYTLLNVKSGKVLDVPNGVASSGQQLWQWEANGTNAQKWIIHQNGDGTFSLVSKLDGSLVIDVLNGDDKNGAVVQLWSYNATNAQKWRFSLVPDISVVSDYYTISSALAANQQVDVAGRSGENSAKIQLYVRNDSQAQKFKLVKNSDSSYTIINTSSGKALDIPDANAKSGAKLQQWASNGSDAQKWILYRHSDNKMTFVSKINQSLVIDVTSGSSSNGTALQLYPYNGTDAQKFSLSALPANDLINGSYVVTSNLNAKKVADIAGAAKSDGTQAQIWTTNDTLAQRFTFSQNADDSWTIANDNSGKAIDVSNANAYAGAKVQQWSLNATNAQKWIARKNSDGTYTFISKLASNLVLDVDNASTADGTRIKLYYDSGNSAQKWTLKRQ